MRTWIGTAQVGQPQKPWPKPMTKCILIFNANPAHARETFSAALCTAYGEAAITRGHTIERIDIAKLDFDPILHEGFQSPQPLEPDLSMAQTKISWAEHIVFVFPMWQFTMPALLKGFCERVFTPDFAYSQTAKNPLDASLLKGRSVRFFQTMGMPGPIYRLYYGAHGGKSFASMMGFTGFKPVKAAYMGMIEDEKARHHHLATARRLGASAQ